MSRQNQTFKAAVNSALASFGTLAPGAELGSEAELAAQLSISRTTARNVLAHLVQLGIVEWQGRRKTLLRAPCPEDSFPPEDVALPAELAERKLQEWILRTDLPPGSQIHESELARQLDIPVALVRDLLQNFRVSGLIEKNPNKHWAFRGFTREYATEMCDMRELIERAAIRQLIADPDHPSLPRMAEMERLHIALLARDDAAMTEFPALDARFHRIICQAADNRFFDEFAHRISIIVHYHYQWNKRDETARNRAAIQEHLAVIQAVLSGRGEDALAAFDHHLATARTTLLASVNWG
jgi:DNA-binding GntR family transcriptional regulator